MNKRKFAIIKIIMYSWNLSGDVPTLMYRDVPTLMAKSITLYFIF